MWNLTRIISLSMLLVQAGLQTWNLAQDTIHSYCYLLNFHFTPRYCKGWIQPPERHLSLGFLLTRIFDVMFIYYNLLSVMKKWKPALVLFNICESTSERAVKFGSIRIAVKVFHRNLMFSHFPNSFSYLRVCTTVLLAGNCFPLSTLLKFIDLLHINLLVIFLSQLIVYLRLIWVIVIFLSLEVRVPILAH